VSTGETSNEIFEFWGIFRCLGIDNLSSINLYPLASGLDFNSKKVYQNEIIIILSAILKKKWKRRNTSGSIRFPRKIFLVQDGKSNRLQILPIKQSNQYSGNNIFHGDSIHQTVSNIKGDELKYLVKQNY
jgi:hypothetical protein